MEAATQGQPLLSQLRGPSSSSALLPVLEHKLNKLCLGISLGFPANFYLGNLSKATLVAARSSRKNNHT